MKIKAYLLVAVLFLTVALAFLVFEKKPEAYQDQVQQVKKVEPEKEGLSANYIEARLKYEFDMLKNPVTGKIPKGIFELEKAFAKTLPVRTYDIFSANGALRTTAANTYIPTGPNNIGGRTRAVLYDRRFNGSTNRVILAGSVSGGIMRSVDGGNSWTRVSPENEIHNLTALAQDPNNPDTWYAGGGEALGNTASEIGALFMGFGIYKSISNGASWVRLPLNSITNLEGTVICFGII